MPVAILSPHLDDAVLSCWSLLDSDDDVAVVTVFTGAPEPGFVSTWDADAGVDSATRMAQRIEENRKALGLTQEDLASRVGIGKTTLSRWETGAQVQQRSLDRPGYFRASDSEFRFRPRQRPSHQHRYIRDAGHHRNTSGFLPVFGMDIPVRRRTGGQCGP